MKKINFSIKTLLKILPVILIMGLYWYWINQRILSNSEQTFGLVGYFFLMCIATAQFPLPANLMVLGAVKASSPLIVAVVGGFATLIAYSLEYLTFTYLFKLKKIANFKDSWLYKKITPMFNKHKFLVLAFTSFLPIPSEPLRIYAITQKYSIFLFILAGFFGRIPRYYLLSYYGQDYVNSLWFLIGIFVFPGILLFIIRGVVSLYDIVKNRLAQESSV